MGGRGGRRCPHNHNMKGGTALTEEGYCPHIHTHKNASMPLTGKQGWLIVWHRGAKTTLITYSLNAVRESKTRTMIIIRGRAWATHVLYSATWNTPVSILYGTVQYKQHIVVSSCLNMLVWGSLTVAPIRFPFLVGWTLYSIFPPFHCLWRVVIWHTQDNLPAYSYKLCVI